MTSARLEQPETGMAPYVQQGRILAWLFIATALTYLFFAGSNFSSGDTFSELHVADSIMSHAGVDVPVQTPGQTCAGWGCQGSDGRFYSTHGIGNSLFLIPFLGTARAAQALLHAPNCANWTRCIPIHLISWNTCLLTSATVTLLAWLGLQLGYDLGSALCVALIYGFASMALPYARYGFDVTITALLLLAAVSFVVGGSKQSYSLARPRALVPGRALMAGTCCGLAVLVRLPSLAALVPLVALVLLHIRRGPEHGWAARSVIAFLGPLAASLAFTAWYNAARYGSVFDDGHRTNSADHLASDPWVGAIGILFSPGKGLIWYCPTIVLCAALAVTFYRARPGACVLTLSIAVLSLIPYILVNDWYGGAAWGPRFVMPVLPLLFLPLLELPRVWQAPRRRALIAAVIVLSVFVQCAGTLVNYADRLHRAAVDGTARDSIWNPVHSPLVDHMRTLLSYVAHPAAATTPVPRSQSFDLWWLNLWRVDGAPAFASTVAGLGVGIFAIAAGIRLYLLIRPVVHHSY